MSFVEKLFGNINEKEIKKIKSIVAEVESYDEKMQTLSDSELREKTSEFKERLKSGETLDDILPEAFAVCREGSVRSLGMKHFHVQLIGGIVLHQGRIAEMKTGEGKTLVATLAAYLNALDGKGVHIVTVNDYLAKRDADWMGKLYTFLGLTVGCVIHEIKDEKRKEAYRADITYGTNNEFGFDYLRDNMVAYKEQLTQRPLNYAIVDEVDSILIDEARTPLIISGQGNKSTELYQIANRFVATLRIEDDFTVDEKDKQVALTEDGVENAEKYFKIENFGDPENMEINHHVIQALKAKNLMSKDIDYIVKDGEIVIVDEFTGRLMYGRRYGNGLHQAIEAKEKLLVRSESKTLATITLQNYFRMYSKLSGMTGTAKTEEEEFQDIYNMDVVEIPTNTPIQRDDMQDAIYAKQKNKYEAIANRVAELHATGQPVLIGTISIERSELLSTLLKKRGIKHNVLNAKHHEKEAEIVAEAGRLGAVTIATNMAGRGTDIILGGNPEFEAKKDMRKNGFTEDDISFATGYVKTDDLELNKARDTFSELHNKYKEERKSEQEKVKEIGGLAIIGTERHEARRIDNQLRGRSGRQGDPGQTQFFLSMEDELLRLFGGERMQNMVQKLGFDEDEALEAKMLTRSIESAQKKVEGKNYGIRRYVLQYDNVMNKQREIIYDQRKRVLHGDNLKDYIANMREEVLMENIDPIVFASKYPEEWDLSTLEKNLKNITSKFVMSEAINTDKIEEYDENSFKDEISDKFTKIYDLKEEEIGENELREIERMVLLRVVDNLWMDHIDAMDQLKSGIGLRSIGQQDPAAAYAQEGFDMFEQMIQFIKEDTVRYCYNVTMKTNSQRKSNVQVKEAKKDEFHDEPAIQGQVAPQQTHIPPRKQKQETIRRDAPKVGRNDPCSCGSGKKYKNCCMTNEE